MPLDPFVGEICFPFCSTDVSGLLGKEQSMNKHFFVFNFAEISASQSQVM
jgi:hypothetical protein